MKNNLYRNSSLSLSLSLLLRDKFLRVLKGTSVFLAAIALVVGGFFVANFVLAAHTTTSMVDRVLVKGGSTNPYTFTIHNAGADSVYKITINAATGFTINPSTIVCPSGWNNDGSSSASTAVCLTDVFDPNVLLSGGNANITFQATAPLSNAALAWNVVTRDVSGGFTYSTDNNAVTTVDSLAPTISAAVEKDTNGDGKIDTVSVTFSEPIKDSTVVVSQFALNGTPFDGFSSGTADDTMGDFTISAGVVGTEKKEFTYTAGSLTDLVGNLMTSKDASAISEQDQAAPVFMSARTTSPTTITATFSEPLNTSTADRRDFAVGANVESNNITSTSHAGDGSVITLNLSSAIGTGDTPQVYYNSTWSAGVRDAADKMALTKDLAPTDGIAPVIVSTKTLTTTTIQVTFSEPMGAILKTDFTVADNTVSDAVLDGGNTTATLTLGSAIGTGATPQVSTIASPSVGTKDLANNVITGSLASTPVDGIAPTVTITSTATSPTKTAPIPITVTFSENVTGFESGDIAVSNGIKGELSGSGAVYHFDITSPEQGAVTVNIAGSVAQDLALAPNGNTAVTQFSITYDSIAPTVILSNNHADFVVRNADTVVITATFNEAMASAPTISIDAVTNDITNAVMSGAGTTWTYSWDVPANNDGVAVATVVGADLAGNAYAGGDNLTFTIDNTNPTPVLQITPVATPNKDNTPDVVIRVENNVGWAIKNGENIIKSGTGTGVDQTVTFDTLADELYDLDLLATDTAGNQTQIDLSQFRVDATAPTMGAGADVLTKTQTTQTGTASDDGSGLASYLWEKQSGPGTITFGSANALITTVSANTDGTYVLKLTVTDVAGNSASDTFQLIWDTAAPTVLLTKDHTDLIVLDADNVVITATFNEAMTAPTISIGSLISGAAMTNTSGNIWTYTWNVPAGNDGAAAATVAGADLAGNAYVGTASLNFVIDNINPTVAITSPTDSQFIYSHTGQITLVSTANDANTITCQYKIDSGTEQAIGCTGGAISAISDGKKTLTLTVTDIAGNSNSANVVFIMDTDGILSVDDTALNNPDFTTIQAAINAATPDDTISVAAGAYNENVNVNKSLTLTGAGSSSVTVTAANPAISVFNVTVSNVNISGFTVSGATGGGQAGIFLSAGVVNCNIHDNILTGSFDGVWLGAGSNHNTLANNTANSNTTQGFEIYHSDYNTFTNNIASSNTNYGFKIESASHNTFTSNTANSNGKHGFYLVTGPLAGSTGCNYNTFTSNTASTNTDSGIRMNGRYAGDSNHNILTGNTFSGNSIGITIYDAYIDVVTMTVTDNNISGNTSKNVSNGGISTLNAANNWWGTAVKSAIQAKISDHVTFEPYYVTSNTGAGGILSNVEPMVISVDGGYPTTPVPTNYYFGYNAFATIQAGVTAVASGGTVNVAAGTYSENVNVNKSLTLQGTGNPTVTAADPAVSVFNVTASSVNISGFTITGANVSTTAGIYLGNDVALCNISNNILTGNGDGIWLGSGSNHNTLTDNTLSSNYQGFEVYHSDYNTFTDNHADSNNVYGFKMESADHNTFTGNTANSNAKYGFYLAAGSSNSDNNTFTNNTANSNTEYGMRINSSDGNTLTNNTFNLNIVDGIRLKDTITNLTLDSNDFTSSGIGIDIAAGAGDVTTWTVNNNNISENTTGISNAGTGTLNAAKNWWGSITGPTHSSNPGGAGNAVSNNVSYAPWCTELTCNPTLIDETPPTVTFVSGLPDSLTNQTSATIIIDGTDVLYYKSKLDGVSYSAAIAVSAPISLSGLTAGSHTLYVIGRDQAGNWQAEGSVTTYTWTIDIAAPAAPIISSVADDNKINIAEKAAIVIVGTAEANSLVSVSLTSGASVTGTQQLTGNATAYSITLNGTTLTDGTVNVSATARDAAGNTSDPATTTALKDTIAPAIAINDGTEAGPVQTDTIKLTVTEVNPDTSKYGFSADNICDASDTYGTDFTSAVEFSIAGNYTNYLCAKATDTAGNTTYQLVGQLNTDNTNPTLTLGSLFTGQTLTGGRVSPINWTAADLNFGATPIKLEYSIDVNDGATWNPITNTNNNITANSGRYSWEVPTQINSSAARIKITATDLATNSTSTQSNTFTIAYSETPDTTPPVVTLNSPNGGENWVGGSSHVITWTATDTVTPAGSITIKLEYSIDGSATWHDIIASTDNDGAYLWTATSTATTNALVKVTATDAAANVGSDLSNAVFTITAQSPASICHQVGITSQWTCNIALSAGWNLVSLPVIVSDTAIGTVLSGVSANMDLAEYWNGSAWVIYKPGFTYDLTTMGDGKGYWINMTAPATLAVTGTKAPAAPDHAPTYGVLSGWNLIGFKSTISQLAQTYLQTLSTGSYTLLNASNENKNSGNMDAGKGYWLWMSGAGSIVTYSETE